MEKEIKVEPYAVIQVCDNCKEGEMVPTNEIIFSKPPQYEHECTNCGGKINFNKTYPTINYRRME